MIGGGGFNTASGLGATIGGGLENVASGPQATVGGGSRNYASGDYATVAGGGGGTGCTPCISNAAGGVAATVPGGQLNVATGNYSFAAGRRAKANDNGSFVWGDSTDGDVFSTGVNTFTVRAAGGVTFYSHGSLGAGVKLAIGANSWSALSDRDAKENFGAVDGAALLEKLNAIPMETWNYRTQDTTIRHMGPMAQDFRAAFGLGEDDKHISTIDADGVALAGVQALYRLVGRMVQEKDAQIEHLTEQVRQLQDDVKALQAPQGADVSRAGR